MSIILQEIRWEQYKQIDNIIGEGKRAKLLYYQSTLEILPPNNQEQEYTKSSLGLLLSAYMREKDIRFYGRGGLTLEVTGEASITLDDSYNIEDKRNIPDLVIDVSSSQMNRQEIYHLLRIPEIWYCDYSAITIFVLENDGYMQVERSKFLPDLDISLLQDYLEWDQYDAVSDLIARQS